MKAIKFDLNFLKIGLKKIGVGGKYLMVQYKENWPKPSIHHPNQVLIKTLLGGICATDIHQMNLHMSSVASVFLSKENPSDMGHELLGEIIEIGEAVEHLKSGDRVVFSPLANCQSFGFKECTACENGNYESCLTLVGVGDGSSIEDKWGGRGNFNGFNSGAFSEYVVAFENQLFKISDSIPDEIAVLVEPFAIAVHAVIRNMPQDSETVLIIGSGIIGLMIIVALRALGSKSNILVSARYPFQAKAAIRLGADESFIIGKKSQKELYKTISKKFNIDLIKPMFGKSILFGNTGIDAIFDCVGNDTSLDDSLRLVKSNGKIFILGMGFGVTKKVDWSLVNYKEIGITGNMCYGVEEYQGRKINTFNLAIELIEKNQGLFKDLITHKFNISDYKTAFHQVENKSKYKTIKALFTYT